jgi:hypothetical protein
MLRNTIDSLTALYGAKVISLSSQELNAIAKAKRYITFSILNYKLIDSPKGTIEQ